MQLKIEAVNVKRGQNATAEGRNMEAFFGSEGCNDRRRNKGFLQILWRGIYATICHKNVPAYIGKLCEVPLESQSDIGSQIR